MSQVMVFQLGNEYYGLDITKIREIVEPQFLTPVPKTPAWVDGMINHHGRIAVVLNLAAFFDFPRIEGSGRRKIALIDDPAADIGIQVEDPLEVISEWQTKTEVSGDSEAARNKYVSKVAVSGGRVINMLDIGKLILNLDSYFL